MFTIITESKAWASAGLTMGVYPICITLATTDLNQVTFYLDLEGIFLQLNEGTTTTVNRQRFGEGDDLSCTFGYITNSLATIHQVGVVGLYVTLPNRSFLNCNHMIPQKKVRDLNASIEAGVPAYPIRRQSSEQD